MAVLWVLAVSIAAAAIGINIWATLRVLRFPFTKGQRAAQTVLIWCIPGFCLLSLFVTRKDPDHTSTHGGSQDSAGGHGVGLDYVDHGRSDGAHHGHSDWSHHGH